MYREEEKGRRKRIRDRAVVPKRQRHRCLICGRDTNVIFNARCLKWAICKRCGGRSLFVPYILYPNETKVSMCPHLEEAEWVRKAVIRVSGEGKVGDE